MDIILEQGAVAADGTAIFFDDKTIYGNGTDPLRIDGALLVFAHLLGRGDETRIEPVAYHKTDGLVPETFSVATPEDATRFEIPLPQDGDYRITGVFVPLKTTIPFLAGVEVIGNYYYNVATSKVEKVLTAVAVTLDDDYAIIFGYIDLADLLAAEALAGHELVPRFSYTFEELKDEELACDLLGNASLHNGSTYVLCVRDTENFLARLWLYIKKLADKCPEKIALRNLYEEMFFEVEGAWSSFALGYHDRVVEVLDDTLSVLKKEVNRYYPY